jgi:uncharacterized protein (TIGR00730 family)
MKNMKTICVYCGSSVGRGTKYIKAATALGRELANQKLTLVYGGGNIGLMNVLAGSALKHGGNVIGVIPRNLFGMKLARKDISKLIVTRDMHSRKAKMAELSDAFIALPGGIGTLEEFAEAVTWNQLHIHAKPCGLLNTGGYFDKLIKYLEHSVKENFYNNDDRASIIVEKDPAKIISKMRKAKTQLNIKDWKEILE